MKKFIIGIISYGKNLGRIDNATKLFNQLKNYPKLIIAQGYMPEKTNKDDIIIYEKEALGICKARARLIEEFLKLNYEYIIFMDDDVVIKSINNDAEFTDYVNQDILFMHNLQVSKTAIEKIDFDFLQACFPGEDIRFNYELKRYYNRSRKTLFTVQNNFENSTWRENNG